MKLEQKILLIGGIAGALIGLAAAFLYLKGKEEKLAAIESGEEESLGKISPAAGISVGMSVIGLLRQIVTLGD